MELKLDLDINTRGEYVLTSPCAGQSFTKLIYKGKNTEILKSILFTIYMDHTRKSKESIEQAGSMIEKMLKLIDNTKER